MIVSRSVNTATLPLTASSVDKGSTSRSSNPTNNTHGGSVLSLPYSSRTLLTYNSASSTQRSSGRSTTDNETLDRMRYPRYPRDPIPTPNDLEDLGEDSDPPYETIPSVPPNINNFITTEAVVTSSGLNICKLNQQKQPLPSLPHDDSVISAHDTHTGIYNIHSMTSLTSPTTLAASSNLHGKNVELLRKKLLMQDANETRL